MNYYTRNPLDDAKAFVKKNSIFSRLLIINVAVFLAVNLINLILRLNMVYEPPEASPLIRWLSVPASLEALAQKPWTILTYMFLQQGFFHLFFNMLVFYVGGRIFLEYMNEKKLLSTYLLGGLAGAILYIAFFNIFPLLRQSVNVSIALGASASVLAILVAIASYVPNYTLHLFLFGRVKLKYVAIVFIALDLINIFTVNTRNPNEINFGGHIAHVGGALWGYYSIHLMKKGHDMSRFLDYFNFKGFWNYFRKPASSPKYKTTSSPGQRPINDDEYNYKKAERQKRVDHILEKISKSGYASLSKEEKEFLFKMSNKS